MLPNLRERFGVPCHAPPNGAALHITTPHDRTLRLTRPHDHTTAASASAAPLKRNASTGAGGEGEGTPSAKRPRPLHSTAGLMTCAVDLVRVY